MNNKKELRIKIWNKYDKHCAYCGELLIYESMQVDHIIPQYNFYNFMSQKKYFSWSKIPEFLKHLTVTDVNHFDNLNPSCRACNKRKDRNQLEFFRSELSKQLEKCEKTSANYRMAKKFEQVVETVKPIVFYFEKIARK